MSSVFSVGLGETLDSHSRDQNYFSQSTRPSAQPSDNWVLRFSALKRLYRLMTQYFSDVLNQPTGSLEVPDLQAMAKESDVAATLIMCHLTVAIAVHCEQNAVFIEKIQGLKEQDQHYLMRAIEQVRNPTTNIHDIGRLTTLCSGDVQPDTVCCR